MCSIISLRFKSRVCICFLVKVYILVKFWINVSSISLMFNSVFSSDGASCFLGSSGISFSFDSEMDLDIFVLTFLFMLG